jgi:hypothetical protein
MVLGNAKPLEGIQYVTNAKGEPTAVLLDLHLYGEVWEDLYETLVAQNHSPTSQERAEQAMTQEEAAYENLHPELIQRYAGQYVAIWQEQLIDHDVDELVLLARIEGQYGNEVVLMKQVRPLPEPELRIRSPRLIPQL